MTGVEGILPNSDLLVLLKQSRNYKIRKGQVIQSSDGRPVLNYIERGYVKRYAITNSGGYDIQSIYGPTDFFPLTLVFKVIFDIDLYDGPEIHHYESMADSQLYTIDAAVLKNKVNQQPELYRSLLFEAGRRLHSNIQRLENLSLSSSYYRVAHQLVYFAKQFGQKRPDGLCIPLRLTHQDLADVLSLTRETVSNNMIKLRDKGLIKPESRIIIPNLKKLEKEAYS